MHRPRHAQTIRSLRMAALLLCLNRLVIVVAVLAGLVAVITEDLRWSQVGLILVGVAVPLSLLQWIFASGGKCPLCMMPVLSKRGCSRHRGAARVAGSHRFPVAFSVLFRGHFRCPYCNEPTVLEVRRRSAK